MEKIHDATTNKEKVLKRILNQIFELYYFAATLINVETAGIKYLIDEFLANFIISPYPKTKHQLKNCLKNSENVDFRYFCQ